MVNRLIEYFDAEELEEVDFQEEMKENLRDNFFKYIPGTL